MTTSESPHCEDYPSDLSTRQKLLHLLADNAIHSGQELADTLGLSKTAVWKHLRELARQGLPCHAVRGRGYQLPHPVELLDETRLRSGLHPVTLSHLAELQIHPHLDSTNTHLMRQARKGDGLSGTVCLADSQGAGRGRMSRQWMSPPGANIYLSLLWHYQDYAYLTGLSLAIGVAVVRALRACGVEGVNLKWPNDILWQDRKLGGILIEATGMAHGDCQTVIGLGINRYLPPAVADHIDQPWVDLHQIQGRAMISRNHLIASLLNEIMPLLHTYPEKGLATYLPEWQSLHHWAGRQVSLLWADKQIQGTLETVSDQGCLILRAEDGKLYEFGSGEVRLRPV